MDADHARKGIGGRSVSGGVILCSDVCSSLSYTGRTRLCHLFNGESEINTHHRQSSMPIFSQTVARFDVSFWAGLAMNLE